MNVFPLPPLLFPNAILWRGIAIERARGSVATRRRSGHPRDQTFVEKSSLADVCRVDMLVRASQNHTARCGPSKRVRRRLVSVVTPLVSIATVVNAKSSIASDDGTRVFLDVGACASGVNASRAMDGNALCEVPEMFGRIVIELDERGAPDTSRNFLRLVEGEDAREPSLRGTTFHKIDRENGYVVGGKAGTPRLGQVATLGTGFENGDVTRASAFAGKHFRPGTVSLALESAQKDGEYGTTAQFLITTGPAPVPSLDGKNIVFGRVVEGLDVVNRLASEKTFKPTSTARTYNAIASLVGDSRAEKAKSAWVKPTRALVITDCGVLRN